MFIEFQICKISSIRAIGHFLRVWFAEFLKVLEVSLVTQVAAPYFKIALYGHTIQWPLKDTVIYNFDLCGRNGVKVTDRKCKS